jgi:hypothetical protein
MMTDESQPEQVAQPTGPVLVDLSKMNWELLRSQKGHLEVAAGVLDDYENQAGSEMLQALFGIEHLLDHIQFEAAKVLGEEAVFGKAEDGKPINAP